MTEQKQYRDDLLKWCDTVKLNWDSMKPKFSKLSDLKILNEWEESCRQLKEKLQEDIKADIEDFENAKSLYEQWGLLFSESIAYPGEIEIESENYVEIDDEYFVSSVHHQEMETEPEQDIDVEELNQYRKDLLEWCNSLYSNWNKSKPSFSNLVDNESLEGWEALYARLKEKLEEDLTIDNEDYETATYLYEQWKNLLEESYSFQEEIEEV